MDETVDNSLETVDDVGVGMGVGSGIGIGMSMNASSGAKKLSVGTALLLAGSVYV